MGFFDKMKEPVFLKENSDAEIQLEKLKALEPLLNEEGKSIIKQDIKYLEYGIIGEKNIAFELKNSHMPIYVLHDIYLEDGDLNAQIDYIVYTRKMCFVVECKNLYGNVEVNNSGDFVRTMEFGGKKKKEGIYSPITQNKRHMELMKKIQVDRCSNKIKAFLVEKNFDTFNKSIVVLANPKTVLNAKYAKKEIKDKVIRADQLVEYIKTVYNNSKEIASSDAQLLDWASKYLHMNKNVEKDYTSKYEKFRIDSSDRNDIKEVFKEKSVPIVESKEVTKPKLVVEETDLIKELKVYRLETSRKEKIKPYFIFNDVQLNDLICKMPRSNGELKNVSGFGEVKTKKYGKDITGILNKYQK